MGPFLVSRIQESSWPWRHFRIAAPLQLKKGNCSIFYWSNSPSPGAGTVGLKILLRRVEEAIEAKDAAGAAAALQNAAPLIARAAQKGIIHDNAAARKISRLTKRVKALAV